MENQISLIDLIKSVASSWQVIAVAFCFIIWCLMLSMITNPRKRMNKPKKVKLKRPKEKKKDALPADVNTEELGLGE